MVEDVAGAVIDILLIDVTPGSVVTVPPKATVVDPMVKVEFAIFLAFVIIYTPITLLYQFM